MAERELVTLRRGFYIRGRNYQNRIRFMNLRETKQRLLKKCRLKKMYRANEELRHPIFLRILGEVKRDKLLGMNFISPRKRRGQTLYAAELRNRLDKNKEYVRLNAINNKIYREIKILEGRRVSRSGKCKDCNRKIKAKKYCIKHYNFHYNRGTL